MLSPEAAPESGGSTTLPAPMVVMPLCSYSGHGYVALQGCIQKMGLGEAN